MSSMFASLPMFKEFILPHFVPRSKFDVQVVDSVDDEEVCELAALRGVVVIGVDVFPGPGVLLGSIAFAVRMAVHFCER